MRTTGFGVFQKRVVSYDGKDPMTSALCKNKSSEMKTWLLAIVAMLTIEKKWR